MTSGGCGISEAADNHVRRRHLAGGSRGQLGGDNGVAGHPDQGDRQPGHHCGAARAGGRQRHVRARRDRRPGDGSCAARAAPPGPAPRCPERPGHGGGHPGGLLVLHRGDGDGHLGTVAGAAAADHRHRRRTVAGAAATRALARLGSARRPSRPVKPDRGDRPAPGAGSCRSAARRPASGSTRGGIGRRRPDVRDA